MFPLYRGARCPAAAGAHRRSPWTATPRPTRRSGHPTVVLTETMVSTGHLPKFADDAYHLERDDLWAIPTAEVPLTRMHRGEILEESVLPMRFTAATACYRREAGSAGRDTRGLLRVHEFDKVELFAYTTPDQALDAQADILRAGRIAAAGTRPALPRHGPVHRRPRRLVGPDIRPGGVLAGCRPVAGGQLDQLVPRLPGPAGQRPLPPGRTAGAPQYWCTRSTAPPWPGRGSGPPWSRTAARRTAPCACPSASRRTSGGELLLKAP